VHKLFFLISFLFCFGYVHASDGLIQTINYQGYLQDVESGAPVNGTFSMTFYIHPAGQFPPFDTTAEDMWFEFYEKVTVKDGVFYQRLGVINSMERGIFRSVNPKELTIKIVPFGTVDNNTNRSYLGPMSIDGNAYSVSTVAKKGADTKEGTLKIIPFNGSQPSDVIALLEVNSPQSPNAFHNVDISYTKGGEGIFNKGKGLVIRYPEAMTYFEYQPQTSPENAPWGKILFNELGTGQRASPTLDLNNEYEDVSVYIENGIFRMCPQGDNECKSGGALTIKPIPRFPSSPGESVDWGRGDLEAQNANVSGDIRVNSLQVIPGVNSGSGTILGANLQYCDNESLDCTSSTALFGDYVIDPYPSNVAEKKSSKINALEIASYEYDSTAFGLGGNRPPQNEEERGELKIEGPNDTAAPASIFLSGSDSIVQTPRLISPYPSKTKYVDYKIAPGGISVLDSAVLITNDSINIDPDNPEREYGSVDETNAAKAPLNQYSAFDLVATAPLCVRGQGQCNDEYCMALRENYCDDFGTTDKYYDIDPCQGVQYTGLRGYRLHCLQTLESDHPNFQAVSSNPSAGKKYFTVNHKHSILEDATPEAIVDIINAAPDDLFIRKHILPRDAVNLTVKTTLTGVNAFTEVWAAHRIVAAHRVARPGVAAPSVESDFYRVDAYMGSQDVKSGAFLEIGSLRTDVKSIGFYNTLSSTIGMDLYAKSGRFDQLVDIGRHVKSNKDFFVTEKSGTIGGNLTLPEPGNSTTPLFYHRGPVVVAQEIEMNGVVGGTRDVVGITEMHSTQYTDYNNSNYYINPDETSIIKSLVVTGPITVFSETKFGKSLFLANDLNVEEDLTVGSSTITASVFSDIDNPAFYVDPENTSRINDLIIARLLDIKGDLFINANLNIDGTLEVQRNFIGQRNLFVNNAEGSVQSKQVFDFSQPQYELDPSDMTRLRNLHLIDNPPGSLSGGHLTVDGSVTLSRAITHQGDARIDGTYTSQTDIQMPRILDVDNVNYLLDPNGTSILKNLDMTVSYTNTGLTSFHNDLQINQNLVSDDSVEVLGSLSVVRDFVYFSRTQVFTATGPRTFHVDYDGNLSARSLRLSSDLKLDDLYTEGSLLVYGGDIVFNADTSMDRFAIETHSLISMNISTPLTYFTIDPFGHTITRNEVSYKGKLRVGNKLDLTTEAGNLLVFSDSSNSLSTVVIGVQGEKDLKISGLSSDELQAQTGWFRRFEDLDDTSNRYLDPSSYSQLNQLQIAHSLSSQWTLTAVQMRDLQNNYIVDPSVHSHLVSLEVLDDTTSEQILAKSIFIDSSNQTPGTSLLDTVSLTIQDSQTITYNGNSEFYNMLLAHDNNGGLRIASSLSTGTGIVMTPGDLSTLIDGSNADYLHRHDLVGGVPIYNLGRQDIDNFLPDPTTDPRKALHGQNTYTRDGLVLSVRPANDSGTKPLFGVLDVSGSEQFSVHSSGSVFANQFIGRGDEVSNISGGGTTWSAIVAGSIATVKVADDSLDSSHFQSNVILNRHIQAGALSSLLFQDETLQTADLMDAQVFAQDLADNSVLNTHIATGQIDTRVIRDGAIHAYHVMTATLSGSKIIAQTITGRVIGYQAIDTSKVQDGSVFGAYVSSDAIDSSKIIIDSLTGDNFSDLSIATSKIQTNAVINSKFASLAVTNADFASDSVTSSKIATSGILAASISTNTLLNSAFANNSISYHKIVSLSVLAIDVRTHTIAPSAQSSQHKIADFAIETSKILTQNILGEHFVPDNILLSHMVNNTVTSTQITSYTILTEDIANKTLQGEKIQDLTIATTQINDGVILAIKIDDKVFDSTTITKGSLTSRSFEDASITLSKVAANTVYSTHIKDLSLQDFDFAANELVESKWASNTISSIKVNTAAITLAKLDTGAVESAEVAFRNITTTAIEPAAILTEHIRPQQITTSKIASLTVTDGDLGNLQIDARVVAPDSLYSTNIIDLSIVSSLIPSYILTSNRFLANSVTEWKIATNQLDTIKFALVSIVDEDFATTSVFHYHIDTETISSRVIGDAQVLTTHLLDEAVVNLKVAPNQLGTRVVIQNGIVTSDIKTWTLTNSDFANDILTDSHFAGGSVTDGKIANNSLGSNVWESYTLRGYHVVPQTITSASLENELITSSKIALDNVSGFHIDDLSITDIKLTSTALVNRVFASRIVSSHNVVDESLLSQDFATGNLLTTHFADRQVESIDFDLGSILTTHIQDFTLESSAFAANSVTSGKILSKPSYSTGFLQLNDSTELATPYDVMRLQSGKILVFSAEGIFRFDSISSFRSQRVGSITSDASHFQTIDKKVWVSFGDEFHVSEFEGERFLHSWTFPETIVQFRFEDEYNGVLVTASNAYITEDGGYTFRRVRTGTNFVHMFSRNQLGNLWLIQQDGNLFYTEDRFVNTQTKGLADANDANFNFYMISDTNGIYLSDNVMRTSNDNWDNDFATNVPVTYSPTDSFIDTDGDISMVDNAGRVVKYNFALLSQSDQTFEYLALVITRTSSHLFGENNLIMVYTDAGDTSIKIGLSTDTGANWTLKGVGQAQANLERYTSIQTPDGSNLFVVRGNNLYRSTDNGQTFSSLSRAGTAQSFISNAFFVDGSDGFAAFKTVGVNTYTINSSGNGGNTWSASAVTGTTQFKFYAASANNVYALQLGQTSYRESTDGFGVVAVTENGGFNLYDIQGSGGTVYMVGDGGNLLRDTNPGLFNSSSSYVVSATVNFRALAIAGSGFMILDSSNQIHKVTSWNATSTVLENYTAAGTVYDVCARSQNEVLAVGQGQDTKVSYDGGTTWFKLLPDRYDSTRFTDCQWRADESIYLSSPDGATLVYRIGEGIEGERLAAASIDQAKIIDAFDSSHFVGDSFEGSKLDDDSLHELAWQTNSIVTAQIDSNAVTSDKMSDDIVTTRAFQDYSITNAKIAYEAIDGASKIDIDVLTGGDFSELGGIDYILIQTDSISSRLFSTTETNRLTDADFGVGAIGTDDLDDFTFDGSVIASGVISSSHIEDGSIYGRHFVDRTLDETVVATGAIELNRIAPYTLVSTHVANLSIQTSHMSLDDFWSEVIQDAQIGNTSLKDNSFTGDPFRSRVFSSGLIANGSVDFHSMEEDTIVASQVQNDSVRGIDFEFQSITLDKIETGAITTASVSTGSVYGDFVATGDMLSSKIAQQSVSGLNIQTHTIGQSKLSANTFQGVDLVLGTLTESKVAARTLTDGHFDDLREFNFATGAFRIRGARVYQSDASKVIATGVSLATTDIGNHAVGSQITYARFSPDGSKVAFTNGIRIYWADSYFTKIRDTGIDLDTGSLAYFPWTTGGMSFYWFDRTAQDIMEYSLVNLNSTVAHNVGVGGMDKVVFDPSNPARWLRLNGNTLTNGGFDGGCDQTNVGTVDIVQSGTYVVITDTANNQIRYCQSGGWVSQSALAGNPEYIKVDPSQNDRVFYFIGNQIVSSELPTVNTTKTWGTVSLTTANDKARAWIYGGHPIYDAQIASANVVDGSIKESHLASFSIVSASFGGAVVTSSHIQTDAVTRGIIATDTLDESVFALGQVTAGHLLNLSLYGDILVTSTILSSRIADGSIEMDRIAFGEIAEDEVNLNALPEAKFSSFSIQTTNMVDVLINNSSMILNNIVTGSYIKTNEVSSFHIVDGTIVTTNIMDEAVLPDDVGYNQIINSKLATATLTGDDFAANVVTTAKIADGAFARGDGFLVTLESNAVVRYDFDGSNRTVLNNSETWDKLQRTVHGNSVTALSGSTAWEIDVISGTASRNLDVAQSHWTVRDRHMNRSFVAGGDSWKSLASMRRNRAQFAAVSYNNRIFAFGGVGGSSDQEVDVYNVDTQTWTQLGNAPAGIHSACTVLHRGTIYVFGGTPGAGAETSNYYSYNPNTDTWSGASTMPTVMALHECISSGDLIYIGGGQVGGTPQSSFYSYDPQSNEWETLASMQVARNRPDITYHNGKVILLGGVSGTGPTVYESTVEEYDPSTNSWSYLTSMPRTRYGAGGGSKIGNFFYTVGGHNGSAINNLDIYDIGGNSWTSSANYPVNIQFHRTVANNGAIYVIGGESGSYFNTLRRYYPGSSKQLAINEDGTPSTVIDENVRGDRGFDYSHTTGKLVYVSQDLQSVVEWDGSTTSTLMTTSGAFSYISPRYSKDGSKVYVINTDSGDYMIVQYNGAASQVFKSGTQINQIRPSEELDKVYYLQSSDLYQIDFSVSPATTRLVLNAATNIDDFDIIPYSAFDEDTIVSRVADDAITTGIWSSRILTNGNFTNGAINNNEIQNNSLNSLVFANNAITDPKISGNMTASVIATGAISSGAVLNGEIQNADLMDGTLLTDDFAVNTLTNGKLSGTIGADKVLNLNITAAKFQAETIQNAQINDDAIDHDRITSGELNSSTLSDGTLLNADFAVNQLHAGVIATGAVTGGHVQASQITSALLALNNHLGSELADDAVTHGNIKLDTIETAKLTDGEFGNLSFEYESITGAALAAQSITTALLADNSIHGDDLNTNLGNSEIASKSLTYEDLIGSSFTIAKFQTNILSSTQISDGELDTSKITDNAIDNAKIGDDVIEGSSFANSAFTTAKIAPSGFNTSHFENIIENRNIEGIALVGANFSTGGDRLTQTDFVASFVDTRNVANSSITTGELATSDLVTSAGSGLRLGNNIIQGTHFKTNGLTGDLFAENAITASMIANTSLSTSTIKTASLLGTNIANGVLVDAELEDGAFTQSAFIDGSIQSAHIVDSTFTAANIYAISSAEILDESITSNKVANGAIDTQNLQNSAFTEREISSISTDDIANLTLTGAGIADAAVTAAKMNSDDPFEVIKFSGSQIPSTRIANDAVTIGKLNVAGNAAFNVVFNGGNADTHHRHEKIDQEIDACPTGYTLVNSGTGKNNMSFCISDASFDTTLGTNKTNAGNISVDSYTNLVGRVCTFEQLWLWDKDTGGSAAIDSTEVAPNFFVETAGFGATLKMMQYGTLDQNGGGAPSSVDVDNSTNRVARRCL